MKLELLSRLDLDTHSGDLAELCELFARMDSAYQQVADRYGFACSGCSGNCCLTLFYHHTVSEYLLLKKGFVALPKYEQNQIKGRADQVVAAYQAGGPANEPLRQMCPLNRNGRCRLYRQRPMICRLHGIPHQLSKPGQPPLIGPGCGEFTRRFGSKTRQRLDRTVFYRQLAELEGRLRRATGFSQRLKITVAGMITTY